jgi:hypothetical protein
MAARPLRVRTVWANPPSWTSCFAAIPFPEADHPENHQTACQSLGLEQWIKLTIVYELQGLNDIAVDTVERFAERFKRRLDVEQAIRLLGDPIADQVRCAGSFATQGAR